MNLLLLLVGLRVQTGSAVEIVTRVFLAVSLFSLEMQLATWTGFATLRTIVAFNVVVATALYLWGQRAAGHALFQKDARLALTALGLLVLLLNAALPVTAADPYHLMRVERIERLGTIAYDPSADPKLNVLGWVYELILADVGAVPIIGVSILKFHGVGEVVLFALTIGAVLQVLGASSRLTWMACCVVPVVFHQFVLIKNDLFGAMPALLILAWLTTRLRVAGPLEVGWAAWILGIVVGMQLTNFPLALVAGVAIVVERRESRVCGAAAAGVLVGLVCGGLMFTLVENARLYGSSIAPYRELGNRNTSIDQAAVSVARFAISLFDMGLLTRVWWPGRGGWGTTYGLPLIWSLAVLAYARRRREARRTLAVAVPYWLTFAAVYPDADIAHRLVLAPGLLVIVVGGLLAEQDANVPNWLRAAAIPMIALSAAQIARSAVLYLITS